MIPNDRCVPYEAVSAFSGSVKERLDWFTSVAFSTLINRGLHIVVNWATAFASNSPSRTPFKFTSNPENETVHLKKWFFPVTATVRFSNTTFN